jgi:hypothetical protein
MVQPQVPGRNMPVEDPTVEWSERDSPFVTVAVITMRKREFDADRQNEFYENLSFSPWHTVEAHRPIGGLNRIRKAVNLEDARYRRSKTSDGSGIPTSLRRSRRAGAWTSVAQRAANRRGQRRNLRYHVGTRCI